MSLFKLSNRIFRQGLGVRELCVYAYLCSIYVTEQTLEQQGIVHVKQSTIGENCGIGSVQTVKKIMDRLIDKGLVTGKRIRKGKESFLTVSWKTMTVRLMPACGS